MEKKITKSRVLFVLLSMLIMFLLLAGIIFFSYKKSCRRLETQADAILERILSGEEETEQHYFLVDIGENHAIINTKLVSIRNDIRERLNAYVKAAMAASGDRGMVDSFRFMKKSLPESRSIRVAFLSRAGNLAMLKSNTDAVIQAALIGYAVFCLVLVLLSRLIVKPLRDADKKQKEFISYAGHALKTPVTIIRSSADLLEEETEKNEWTETIRAQAEHLSELSDRLMMVSKMEGAGEAQNMIDFPLSDVTQEILRSFASVAAQKNISVTQEIAGGITTEGNENELRELITLLIDNAHKYAGQNGEISVALTSRPGEVLFTVGNTSRHYEKEDLERMFDKFYRGEGGEEKGFGLGLYLARLIASRHRGSITAAMKDDSHIILTVTLRRKKLPEKVLRA